ncbi:hypothetical protein [Obesumbacterium proteus]|uniref:hypothetical protein n=1 Tax=Obesumbacterium proteus TaxID=82983 RepID=UPI002430DBF6|nr:hypothetical protein [Obesumbacterium proteus]
MIAVITLFLLIIVVGIVMAASQGTLDPCSCRRCGKYIPAPARFCERCRPAPLSWYQPSKTTSLGKVMPPPKNR